LKTNYNLHMIFGLTLSLLFGQIANAHPAIAVGQAVITLVGGLFIDSTIRSATADGIAESLNSAVETAKITCLEDKKGSLGFSRSKVRKLLKSGFASGRKTSTCQEIADQAPAAKTFWDQFNPGKLSATGVGNLKRACRNALVLDSCVQHLKSLERSEGQPERSESKAG